MNLHERLDRYIEAVNGAREFRKEAKITAQTTWSDSIRPWEDFPKSWAELEQLAKDTGLNHFRFAVKR